MGIRQPSKDLLDWLWEQRHWSSWAEGVVLYYEAHGFLTDKQFQAAVAMREKVEGNATEKER